MTTRPRTWQRVGAAALALGLLAGACGSDDGDAATDAPATTAPMGGMEGHSDDTMADAEAMPTATPAADLRATLTAGLEEHVYLAGIAVYAAVNTPEAFDAAAATLDANSQDIAAAIGSVYGPEAGDVFLELWRTHIGFFVDYANARAAGDQAAADAALAELDAYGGDLGQFLEEANPNLPKDVVAEEFAMHVSTLAAAIDAVVAGQPDAFDLLKDAADHMPMTAAVLAGGIAAQDPDTFSGDPASPAAELRATLTAGLVEHAYLAGIAVYAAVNTPEAFDAAAATLDANSQDIAAAIGSVYGPEAGDVFLELWRTHIGFFVDYANARAAGDQAAADAALAELDAYGGDLGQFLEDANPNLPKDVVAEEFAMHVSTLAAAIDAVVAGQPDAFDLLKDAADHMPMTAAVLAGGIAAQDPDTFTG